MNKISTIGKTGAILSLKPVEGIIYVIIVALSVWLLTTPYYMYAIIPALIIIGIFFLSRTPQFGYYIIIFLIPFGEYRELLSSYQFLTLTKLLGFWILVIVIFYFLFRRLSLLNIKSNLWLWLLIFFLVSLFSVLMSSYTLTSFDNLRKLLTGIIIFALTLIFVSSKGLNKTLPIIIISSTSITSFLAIIGYLFEIPYFAMDLESLKRASGLLGSPNHFAFLILFSLPILIHYFFTSIKPFGKIITFLLFLMNIAAIILTYSRGAAIVLSIVLLIMFIENIRQLKPRHLGFVGLSFIIIIVTTTNLVPYSYWERQTSTFSDTITDETIKRRISYLYVAKDIFRENPVLGSGPGTFKDIYANSSYAREYIREGFAPERYAHNTYIELLTGTGALGFFVFSLILFFVLRNFYKAKKIFLNKGNQKLASLVDAYKLSFISILIYFFMLSSFYHKYFWLSLGLSQIALRLSQSFPEEKISENISNIN